MPTLPELFQIPVPGMVTDPVKVGPAVGALASNWVWMALVTPSTKLSSAAVAVTGVPPMESAVMLTVPVTSSAVDGSVLPIPTSPL